MRRLLVLGLFWPFLLIGCGSADLIVKDQQPHSQKKLDLIKILNEASYPLRPFEEGVFDCSNQLAFLYDHLSRKGYECKIVIGRTFLGLFTGEAHTWLIVARGGDKFLIHPPAKAIVSPRSFKKYIFRESFGSLKELRECWRKRGWNLKEWEY